MGQADPNRRFHRPELDGLRFFAFLAVFVHHAFPWRPEAWVNAGWSSEAAHWIGSVILSGGFGVDLFFCLSSFLITELLMREWDRFGGIDFRAFLVRRALRIWPLYYFALALAFFVVPLFLPHEDLDLRQRLSFLFFVSNWEFAIHGYAASVVAPLWSIAVEEQFYFTWPILVRWAKPKRLRHAALALLAVALVARVVLISEAVPHPGIWCNTLARLDPLALGALLSLALRGRAPRWGAVRRATVIAVALVSIVASTAIAPMNGPVTWHLLWSYLVVGLSCAAILAACLRDAPARASWLSSAPLPFLGRISYGLYVFHVVCIDLVALHLPEETRVSRAGVALVMTLGLAATSYMILERPFLRLKNRFTRIPSRPE